MASIPSLRISTPSASGAREGFPPGLSVTESADIRPSLAASSAIFRTVSSLLRVAWAPGTSSRVTTNFDESIISFLNTRSMSISSYTIFYCESHFQKHYHKIGNIKHRLAAINDSGTPKIELSCLQRANQSLPYPSYSTSPSRKEN